MKLGFAAISLALVISTLSGTSKAGGKSEDGLFVVEAGACSMNYSDNSAKNLFDVASGYHISAIAISRDSGFGGLGRFSTAGNVHTRRSYILGQAVDEKSDISSYTIAASLGYFLDAYDEKLFPYICGGINYTSFDITYNAETSYGQYITSDYVSDSGFGYEVSAGTLLALGKLSLRAQVAWLSNVSSSVDDEYNNTRTVTEYKLGGIQYTLGIGIAGPLP